MSFNVLTKTPVCRLPSLQENPQFFTPPPVRREFDMLGMSITEQLTPKDFTARWWPGTDISESR